MKHFQLQLKLSKQQHTISYQYQCTKRTTLVLHSSHATRVLMIRISCNLWPFKSGDPGKWIFVHNIIFIHNIKQNMAAFFGDISANKRDFKNTGIQNALCKHWRTTKVWNTENHSGQVGSMLLDPQRCMCFAFVKWMLNHSLAISSLLSSPTSRVSCKQFDETVVSWVLSLHHQLLKGPLRHRKYQDNGEHGLRLGAL